MGCCNSKQKKLSLLNDNINNNNNYTNSNNLKNLYKNSKNTIISDKGYMYPFGKAYLLKKVKANTIENDDNLKHKIDLFINLNKVPDYSSYHVNLNIIDNSINGENKFKLASIASKTADNNKSIKFESPVEMFYYFERDQIIEIEIMDSNTNNKSIITERVAKIINSTKNGSLILNNNNGYTIEIKVVSSVDYKKVLNLSNICLKKHTNTKQILDDQNTYNYNNIFIVVKSISDSINWRNIYKTEESDNYKFNDIILLEKDINLNNYENKFKFELYELSETINNFNTKLCTLIKEIDLSLKDIDSNEGYITLDNTPFALSLSYNITTELSFIELIQKGLDISMVTAIDFTASNLDPKNPNSLHYINTYPNEYEKAVMSCANILGYYDSDQKFPLFGFGGIPSFSNNTLDVFPLNNNVQNPFVLGIESIALTYREALTRTKLSGPTNFAPLINNLYNIACSNLDSKVYYTLLIITDGAITDINETIDVIVKCSFLPISIIIIGVGKYNFDSMEVLDGDDIPLKDSNGKICMRDIVQFVPFSKYSNNSNLLSIEVLKELPDQIESYYRLNKLIV